MNRIAFREYRRLARIAVKDVLDPRPREAHVQVANSLVESLPRPLATAVFSSAYKTGEILSYTDVRYRMRVRSFIPVYCHKPVRLPA